MLAVGRSLVVMMQLLGCCVFLLLLTFGCSTVCGKAFTFRLKTDLNTVVGGNTEEATEDAETLKFLRLLLERIKNAGKRTLKTSIIVHLW